MEYLFIYLQDAGEKQRGAINTGRMREHDSRTCTSAAKETATPRGWSIGDRFSRRVDRLEEAALACMYASRCVLLCTPYDS